MLGPAFLGSIDRRLVKAEIMIGELGVGLGRNPFAGRSGVMGQSEIFLVQLLRVTAKLDVGTVRFIRGVSVWHIGLAVAIAPATATAATLCVLRLSHRPVNRLLKLK